MRLQHLPDTEGSREVPGQDGKGHPHPDEADGLGSPKAPHLTLLCLANPSMVLFKHLPNRLQFPKLLLDGVHAGQYAKVAVRGQ